MIVSRPPPGRMGARASIGRTSEKKPCTNVHTFHTIVSVIFAQFDRIYRRSVRPLSFFHADFTRCLTVSLSLCLALFCRAGFFRIASHNRILFFSSPPYISYNVSAQKMIAKNAEIVSCRPFFIHFTYNCQFISGLRTLFIAKGRNHLGAAIRKKLVVSRFFQSH